MAQGAEPYRWETESYRWETATPGDSCSRCRSRPGGEFASLTSTSSAAAVALARGSSLPGRREGPRPDNSKQRVPAITAAAVPVLLKLTGYLARPEARLSDTCRASWRARSLDLVERAVSSEPPIAAPHCEREWFGADRAAVGRTSRGKRREDNRPPGENVDRLAREFVSSQPSVECRRGNARGLPARWERPAVDDSGLGGHLLHLAEPYDDEWTVRGVVARLNRIKLRSDCVEDVGHAWE